MIGDLYDANNVVVGQAALFVAANGVALPAYADANLSDPFDPTPFLAKTLTIGATTTFTLSVGGEATSSLSNSSTAAQIESALEALSTVGAGNVTVTGTTSPFSLTFDESVRQPVTVNASAGTATLTGGLWTPAGATDQGWKYGTNKSVQDISIEEQSTPVSQAINTQAVTYEGALSEDISPTLAMAYNAVLTSTAPTSSDPGYDKLVLTDDVLYYAVCLVTKHFNGMPRWIYAPKCSQLSNASTDFRRANAKRMYAVSFATLCKPSEIEIINFTAAATG